MSAFESLTSPLPLAPSVPGCENSGSSRLPTRRASPGGGTSSSCRTTTTVRLPGASTLLSSRRRRPTSTASGRRVSTPAWSMTDLRARVRTTPTTTTRVFSRTLPATASKAVYRDGDRPRGNIDHVAIRASDLEASTSFYATAGAAAGLTIRGQTAERTGFSVSGPGGVFGVFAGQPTEHIHIAFSGDDDAVRRFHADAIAAGYQSNGEPGERPDYHDGYYAAFVLDPDGNNIEVVNHNR